MVRPPPPQKEANTSAPESFAVVMATGIVSIAARLLGHEPIGWALFALNAALYPAAWAAMLVRLTWHSRAVMEEFTSHDRGPGYLTMVAASSVVGSQCGAFGVGTGIMPWLLALAALLWAFLLYGFLLAIILRPVKPPIRQGLNGGWLLIVVATESLAVLASYVTPVGGGLLIFAALAAFLLGGLLYVLLLALILYRFAFLPMSPRELEGPWWINMGALAIATLAGSRLMQLPTIDPHVAVLRGAAGPITVIFWATATFWIPLLAALFVWKYAVRREPIRYDPGLWSIVFPLSMYTAATDAFSQAAGLSSLRVIPAGFFWLAFLAWLAGALGLLGSVRRLRLVQ